MISFPIKGLAVTTVGLRRLFLAAAGTAALFVALERAPVWFETWNLGAAVGVLSIATGVVAVALGLAIQGSAAAVERVATEMVFLGGALLVAETALLLRAPETWSEDPVIQRMTVTERAARQRGIAYDGRLPSDVVAELRAQGLDAVPGYAQSVTANGAVAAAIRDYGLLPLSNASNAVVVECNEGVGYFKFESDEFGFNNPPGVARGPADVAVIGESLAAGHCVEPGASVVDRIRSEFPRTANFGVAGSRVLSQLAVFREYVEPVEPAVVLWFVNVNYAEARRETAQPLLLRYLNEPSFSQHLRERHAEVDRFVRDVVAPVSLRRDELSRQELENGSAFPIHRVVEFDEVRSLVHFDSATSRAPPAPDVTHLDRAVDLAAETARSWGGELIVVILPSYELAMHRPQEVARYRAVLDVLQGSSVGLVDGVALFAAQQDVLGYFTLRIDNHPGKRGHALLGEAVAAAIRSREF